MSKEGWLLEVLQYYDIDEDLDNEGIIRELKKLESIIRQKLNDEYRIKEGSIFRGKQKTTQEERRAEILREIDKISEVIIIIEGRLEISLNRNDANSEEIDNIIQKRTDRILKSLEMQKRAKVGLNNMLDQFRQSKSKEVEATQKMLNNVCIKIEVLQMQLKLLDIKEKNSSVISDEYVLHDLKNHLKIEEAIVNGANRAMQVLSKSSKSTKTIRMANASINESVQKCSLLKIAVTDLTAKLSQDPHKEEFLENESFFDSIPAQAMNSKVFPVTGTLNVGIVGCSGLFDRQEGLKRSRKTLKSLVHVVVLIDGKEVHRTTPCLPDNWVDSHTSISVFRAKEMEFQVFYQDQVMCALKYLLLEDFIDEQNHQIDLPLVPQGQLTTNICFLNPFINNAAKLKRQNAIPKRLNLFGPTSLGVDLPIWEQMMRSKTIEDESKKRKISDEPQEPQKDFDSYVLLKMLGSGNFGQVIMCKDREGSICAMKIQNKQEILSRGEIDTLRVEMNVLKFASETKNAFLVNLISCFTTGSHVCFVMEFIGGGDLMTQIQRKPFSMTQSIFYAGCVVLGLKYLHDINVLYRDLKLDNLMICADGYVKIADFGLCKEGMTYGALTSTFCGTPEFIAPEMLTCHNYSRAIDWWQFGVLIFEMVTMQPPFFGDDDEELFNSIIHESVDMRCIRKSEIRDIISKLLTKTGEGRLGNSPNDAQDIMDHPFFSTINFSSLEKKSIKSPTKPNMSSSADTSNFDSEFTSRAVQITASKANFSEESNQVFSIFNYNT